MILFCIYIYLADNKLDSTYHWYVIFKKNQNSIDIIIYKKAWFARKGYSTFWVIIFVPSNDDS